MNNKANIKGFSLIELAIVITIIGITLAAGLTVLTEYSKISKIAQTKVIIEEVMEAIDDYADEFGALPCPADPTVSFSDAEYGISSYTTFCPEAPLRSGGTAMGMVPFGQLALYPSTTMDAWGRKLTYVIKENSASGTGLASGSIDLDVKDYDGSTSYAGVVVLVYSHGANGYGAYLGRGFSRLSDTAGSTQEQNNNDPALEFNAAFSKAAYDDIMYFWTKDQIEDESME